MVITLAAVVAEWYERGRAGVADLLLRLGDWRRARWWVVVGLVSTLLLVPIATVAVSLATGEWPVWSDVGVTGRAPGLGPAATWLLMTASDGIGEEVGWRGFLLPRLQANRSALRATLLLTAMWAGWHLPAFWFREGYICDPDRGHQWSDQVRVEGWIRPSVEPMVGCAR